MVVVDGIAVKVVVMVGWQCLSGVMVAMDSGYNGRRLDGGVELSGLGGG